MERNTSKILVLLYLLTESLAISCPTGTYPLVSRCASCGEGCSSCTDNFHCLRCSSGYAVVQSFSDWAICKKRREPDEFNPLAYIALAASLIVLLFALLLLAKQLCRSHKQPASRDLSRLDSSYRSMQSAVDGDRPVAGFGAAEDSSSLPAPSNRSTQVNLTTEVRTSTAFAALFPPATASEHQPPSRAL